MESRSLGPKLLYQQKECSVNKKIIIRVKVKTVKQQNIIIWPIGGEGHPYRPLRTNLLRYRSHSTMKMGYKHIHKYIVYNIYIHT